MKSIPSAILAVILGTASVTALGGGHEADGSAQEQDIVATAAAAGSFTTLLAAIEAAGLKEALQGEGPMTVWAPTDDAFAALPEGTVEALLRPENQDQLRDILLYHVVPARSNSAQALAWAVDGVEPQTLQGAKLLVKSDGSALTVNGANVVAADVAASNGVIHVIDAVLMPPG